jgi:hypothetical protein
MGKCCKIKINALTAWRKPLYAAQKQYNLLEKRLGWQAARSADVNATAHLHWSLAIKLILEMLQ